MSWTTPRTWATGEVVTASGSLGLNTHLRDNLAFLFTPPCFRAYHNTTQSVNSSALTFLALNSERFDTDTMHDNATDNSRGTVKTAGRFLFGMTLSWPNAASARRIASLQVNRGFNIGRDEKTTADCSHAFDALYAFAVSDYVEIEAFQASGGPLSVPASSSFQCELWAHWMSN